MVEGQADHQPGNSMTTSGNIFSYVLFITSGALAIANASAQPGLQLCALIEDNMPRLECYDKLAQTAVEVIHMETAAHPAAGTSGEFFDVDASVATALRSPSRGWAITFENGQSWKQIGTAGFVVKTGDTCTISPGLLNSFLLQCGNRARRIQVVRAD